jgi:hypothetical protein
VRTLWRSHVCCAIYERLFIPLCGIFLKQGVENIFQNNLQNILWQIYTKLRPNMVCLLNTFVFFFLCNSFGPFRAYGCNTGKSLHIAAICGHSQPFTAIHSKSGSIWSKYFWLIKGPLCSPCSSCPPYKPYPNILFVYIVNDIHLVHIVQHVR